ncbi:MAG: hypothetical protein D4R64_16075 [Porphyromonadaceae bacterium]|nr:MAG: hypothetical protein D4R64_16075 [Porphyromonadaceae bacterium]
MKSAPYQGIPLPLGTIADVFDDKFVESYRSVLPVIIIDCDDTNSDTHRAQQRADGLVRRQVGRQTHARFRNLTHMKYMTGKNMIITGGNAVFFHKISLKNR